ncbi:MAG: hypothetical protein E7Y34_01675 [Mycoplasma sp.]|nr:hypothetical protein [Mycoplasma sp.]
MKNKKIILGLGTITALGAMSMGFVACKKTEAGEDALKKRLDLLEQHIGEDKLFGTELNNFFKITTTDSTTNDPKDVKELKNGAKVSDLIAKVKEIKGFKDKFEIISKDSDKDGNTVDGASLANKTEHPLTIMRKGEDASKTKWKGEITFKFTIKAS